MAVRELSGSCAGAVRKSCGSCAGAVRKSCGSCAEKLRELCGKAAGGVRKSFPVLPNGGAVYLPAGNYQVQPGREGIAPAWPLAAWRCAAMR